MYIVRIVFDWKSGMLSLNSAQVLIVRWLRLSNVPKLARVAAALTSPEVLGSS